MLLIVEGLTDAAFFQELFMRVYLREAAVFTDGFTGRENIAAGVRGTSAAGSEFEVNFFNRLGKHATGIVLDELLRKDVADITVSQDIDRGTSEDLIHSINQHVIATLEGDPSNINLLEPTLSVEGATVHTVPMGLANDPALTELGVAQHEMEDYLLLLVLKDAELRKNVPQLGNLFQQILPMVRENDGLFDSSKDILQLAKPMLQHGFSDARVAQNIVSNADSTVLRTVLEPLLSDIERATGIERLPDY